MDTEFNAHRKKPTQSHRAIPFESGETPEFEVVWLARWRGTDLEVTEGGASTVSVEFPTVWRDVGWG
jgi:hypothetical protein